MRTETRGAMFVSSERNWESLAADGGCEKLAVDGGCEKLAANGGRERQWWAKRF